LCPLNNKTMVFGPTKPLVMVFLILSKILKSPSSYLDFNPTS
jgi:hypothetical protein